MDFKRKFWTEYGDSFWVRDDSGQVSSEACKKFRHVLGAGFAVAVLGALAALLVLVWIPLGLLGPVLVVGGVLTMLYTGAASHAAFDRWWDAKLAEYS